MLLFSEEVRIYRLYCKYRLKSTLVQICGEHIGSAMSEVWVI